MLWCEIHMLWLLWCLSTFDFKPSLNDVVMIMGSGSVITTKLQGRLELQLYIISKMLVPIMLNLNLNQFMYFAVWPHLSIMRIRSFVPFIICHQGINVRKVPLEPVVHTLLASPWAPAVSVCLILPPPYPPLFFLRLC